MAKKPATEKRGSNKVEPEKSAEPPINILSMNYYRELARQHLPDNTAESEVGEVAMIYYELGVHLQKHWKPISKICDKNADSQIKIGIQVAVDRRTDPPEVATKISYSEKYGDVLKGQASDQDELPGLNKVETTSETQNGADLGKQPELE